MENLDFDSQSTITKSNDHLLVPGGNQTGDAAANCAYLDSADSNHVSYNDR